MTLLSEHFFQRENTQAIAQELLGKLIFSEIEKGKLVGGIIIETEAYLGGEDRACHAYNYRRTHRTEPMFGPGGQIYVYLCYGLHHLLNIVTHGEGVPHAILIRSLQPTHGLDIMQQRRLFKGHKQKKALTKGPGALAQALGITRECSGRKLEKGFLWIEDRGTLVEANQMGISPRIGVDYAGPDAQLPLRFYIKGAILN
jgi:DNA-3-methyladenine glycosylase